MIKKNELTLIPHLRKNARESLVKIRDNTGMALSTIYDQLKKLEEKCVIKHTSLLDFEKIGFKTKANIAISVEKEDRNNLLNFIKEAHQINTAHKINHEFDFMVEGVFKDYYEMKDFVENLKEKYNIKEIKVQQLLECIKIEEFMTKPKYID
jgi:DNA-binding Lrp family transcriptional regulator